MKKLFSLLTILTTAFAIMGCFSAQLRKADIQQLADKKFFYTGTSFDISKIPLSETDLVLDPALEKEISTAVPVKDIFKVLSEKLNIEEGSAKDRIPGKKENNVIFIHYNLKYLTKADSLIMIVNYYVRIKTASGASINFYLRSPEESQAPAIDAKYLANKNGIKLEDAAKTILFAELKNIPIKLAKAIDNGMD